MMKKQNTSAGLFIKNFEKYANGVNEEVLAAAPKFNFTRDGYLAQTCLRLKRERVFYFF